MDSDIHPAQSDVPDNDASSLRAAALLSRKRRKVAPEAPTLPPRIAPEPSFQLDYGQDGQDESAPAQQTGSKPPPVSHPAVPPVRTNQMEDIEDGQIREEGEISDSETSPPQRRSPTPPPRTRRRPSVSHPHPQEPAGPEIPLPPRPSSRTETEIVSPSEPVEPPAYSWQPVTNSTSVEPFAFETAAYRLDGNHVRPGLAMTQEQYNTAKDIVLDLLGWGVPPEYLLECGLSRHVIYYVFSELNLRLPNNLDISGLIPYPTPEILALIPVSPSLSARSLHSSSSAMPPPSVIPARASLAERMSLERIDTEMSSPDRSPYVKPEPSSPSSADLSNSHSLLMIEQQRRQELLARKAVIASRKARQSEPPGFTPSNDQDVDMNNIPQSVDEFLKTIEPPAHLDVGDLEDHNRVSSIGMTPLSEVMDVDEPIPGFVGISRDTSTFSAGPSSTQSLSSASTATYTEPDSPAAFHMGSTGDVEPSNNGLQRRATIPVDTPSSHPPTLQANPSYASMDDSSYPQRRGTKRPVAADFVDFDGPGPSRGYGNSSSSNGYSNGGALSRRKNGSFAGITGTRRCVIELSDSEDDGDGHVMGDYVGNGDTREYSPVATPGLSARNPQRLTATPTMSAQVVSNGNSAPSGQSSSTNALAEKEEEIKRMRQLIAKREELRLKRLTAISGKSTPMIPLATDAQGPETTAMVKQEETPVTSFGRHDSRDREIDYSSIMDSTSKHGISVAVSDGNTGLLSTDNSATGHSLGLSTQETSPIGRELSAQDDDSEDEQDLMITGEAQTTQVIPPSRLEVYQESSAAGDSGTSSSAQVSRQQSRNEAPLQSSRSSFPLYDSPLSRYPLLQSRFGPATSVFDSSLNSLPTPSHASTSSSSHVHSPSPISFTIPSSFSLSSHSLPITLPDLKRLKQTAVHRSIAQLTRQSAGLRVCQYEVPGGGICRDKDCEELHLGRIAVDPSDAEVASYVHEALPPPWNGRCAVRAIEIALEGVRLRGGAKDVDDRVREALAGLGIPMIDPR